MLTLTKLINNQLFEITTNDKKKIQSVGNKFTYFFKCLVHSMCDYNHSTFNVTMTRHIILNENTELYLFPEMKSGLKL